MKKRRLKQKKAPSTRTRVGKAFGLPVLATAVVLALFAVLFLGTAEIDQISWLSTTPASTMTGGVCGARAVPGFVPSK